MPWRASVLYRLSHPLLSVHSVANGGRTYPSSPPHDDVLNYLGLPLSCIYTAIAECISFSFCDKIEGMYLSPNCFHECKVTTFYLYSMEVNDTFNDLDDFCLFYIKNDPQ